MRNRIGIRWREITRDRWAFGGWVVLGVALLLLAVSIPFSIWLLQQSDGDDPGGVEVEIISDVGPSGDSVGFGDSARLEIRRAPTPSDALEIESTPARDGEGSGQELPVEDGATFGDTVTFEVGSGTGAATEEPEPSGGAAGGNTSVSDSAEFIVRDADGNIKEQGVID